MKSLSIFFVLFISHLLFAEELVKAPSFQLPDRQDRVLDSQTLDNQVVYLDFWASWCVPCRQSFPWLDKMQTVYGDQGFRVVAINLDTSKNQALQFLKEVPASFMVLFDPAGKTPEMYQVQGMPSSYLIDRKGNIRKVQIGFLQKNIDKYEQSIQELLAEGSAQ
jgi:thiol-disulfide isomerase/thioredoxin